MGRRGAPSARDGARPSRRRGGDKATATARRRRIIEAFAGAGGGAFRVSRARPTVPRAAAPLIFPIALRRKRHRGRPCATPRGSPSLSRRTPVARRCGRFCFAGRARDKTYVWLATTSASVAWVRRAAKRVSCDFRNRCDGRRFAAARAALRARALANAASVSSAARYTPQPASPTQRSLLHSFGCKTAPSITAIENVSPPADLARRLPPAPPASLPSTLQQPSPTQRPTTPSVSNGTNYSTAPVATRRSQGFSGGS